MGESFAKCPCRANPYASRNQSDDDDYQNNRENPPGNILLATVKPDPNGYDDQAE